MAACKRAKVECPRDRVVELLRNLIPESLGADHVEGLLADAKIRKFESYLLKDLKAVPNKLWST